MAPSANRPRLAVVSPFLDKKHGTERRVVEWVSCLADSFEIHVYSQRVEDLDLSQITWHKIPKLPGPHLLNFLWWLAANHLWRALDRRFRGLPHDLTFTPGPNCLDADAISIHIVFAEFLHHVQPELRFAGKPITSWPRLLHRRIYYQLAIALERRAYTNPETVLILIARKTAADLDRFYGRRDSFPILYMGLDHSVYNPARRQALREKARAELRLSADRFEGLMVGNDWRKKGIRVLLEAMEQLRELPIDLLVAGGDDTAPFEAMVRERQLEGRVRFLPSRKDVEFYYAAADTYAGPSLEDTFAQPPTEAMACGLPVIVSSTNGTCEIITDGTDGWILQDPSDAKTLASMFRRLYENPALRESLGNNAAKTAARLTWEQNGRDLLGIFEEILRRKARPQGQALTQES